MSPYPSMRSLLFGAGLFAAGMAVATALGARPAPAPASFSAGATVAGFLPDDVMALSYATPWGMTTAQRSLRSAAFQMLSTFADGRVPQRCTASPAMTGHLADLSVLTARRELSGTQREREFPALLGVIQIRTAAISEPGAPVVAFANRDRSAVAVVVDGRAAEVTLAAAQLRWLETACEEAAADGPPRDGGDNARRRSAYRRPGRTATVR